MHERVEKDTMGEITVPADALYGAQTARAVENFPISGTRMPHELIWALGLIKHAAAAVNNELGKLESELADAITQAADEVMNGDLDAHFPVDIFQTGSGTSSNMNANEVIANRAIQLLGGTVGSKKPVHPNDHVNMGQSSNDVFPAAIHIAALFLIDSKLVPALEELHSSLSEKCREFDDVVKIGRTHLQDATPIRLGQEFSGYASQVAHGITHIRTACEHLKELPIGGTAVGTGINTHPEFGARMARRISELAGVSFVEAGNHFEAQAAQDAVVHMSGTLKTVAVSLIKIANDIRWLGSGPRLGLGELEIPAVQPGSSIMPGKVNPVIAESLIMVCAQVIGNDAAVTLGGLSGNFELNVMLPLIARNVLEQITLLSRASLNFSDKLVRDLGANRQHIEDGNEKSLSLATALVPILGYDTAAQIAKKAFETGKTVRELVREDKTLSPAQLEDILDLRKMTSPQQRERNGS
jgi:fumarate hydratase class II